MKIVITGIGETGRYLAEVLLKENHDLVLVEKDESTRAKVQEHFDAQIVAGERPSV